MFLRGKEKRNELSFLGVNVTCSYTVMKPCALREAFNCIKIKTRKMCGIIETKSVSMICDPSGCHQTAAHCEVGKVCEEDWMLLSVF